MAYDTQQMRLCDSNTYILHIYRFKGIYNAQAKPSAFLIQDNKLISLNTAGKWCKHNFLLKPKSKGETCICECRSTAGISCTKVTQTET